MNNVLNIKSLSVAFQTDRGSIKAVDEVEFNIRQGEAVALLGESGCGKSLTTLALLRLLPEHAVYGSQSRVLFSGQDLLDLPEKIMRSMRGRRLAIIFQEPMTALNPVLSIGAQLAETIQQHESISRRKLKNRMLELLNEVEISHAEQRLKQYPHQLSGGQKQRIVIAMALAARPEILIADEPTTALDVTIQAQILKLLKKLQCQHQMGLLLITHDLGVVKKVADRVYVMYAGQIVERAEIEDFFHQPLHPYSQQLLASLPSLAKRGERLQAIPGNVPVLNAMPRGCRFHPRCAHVFSPCADIEPLLQEIAGKNRLVRCHLYPEHSKPPALRRESAVTKRSPSRETSVVLSVDDLKVYFMLHKNRLTGKKEVLKAVDGLSFTLSRGKTLALVGESGCGKTTAARALLRLLPVTSGAIEFCGKNINALYGHALFQFRQQMQIIFQDPFSSMNPRMTIAEILAEGLQFKSFNSQQLQKRQKELLDIVNLPSQSLGRYPHQFSGGQRQRIAIARALATEPQVLICDEPTSALDISVQAQILNLLKDLQEEQGIAYLFITHNLGVVSYLADEILVMRNGQAVEHGPCKEILQNPKHPYTQKLLSSVLTV